MYNDYTNPRTLTTLTLTLPTITHDVYKEILDETTARRRSLQAEMLLDQSVM